MRRDNCVNEPNGGSHFAVYTCINSSCCTHEIYTMLYVNFISVMAGKKSTDLPPIQQISQCSRFYGQMSARRAKGREQNLWPLAFCLTLLVSFVFK